MNTMSKILMMMLMMNIVVYLGMNLAISAECQQDIENCKYQATNNTNGFKLQGDLLDKAMSDSMERNIASYRSNYTEYGTNFTSEFTTFPDKLGGESEGVGGISFLDPLNILWDFFKTLFNIAVSPITLFTTTRVPFIFMALIGTPYMILFVMTVVSFIKGVVD